MKKIALAALGLVASLSLTSCSSLLLSNFVDLDDLADLGLHRPGIETGENISLDKGDNKKETDLIKPEDNDQKEHIPEQLPGTNNNNNNNNNNSGSPSTLGNVNNGVLKEARAETMAVPANMKNIGTDSATESQKSSSLKAKVAVYALDGDIVNWITENDILYVITKGNNRLVIIDAKTMLPVANTPLSGVPAEIISYGDKIYISFPDLCRVDSFSKTDGAKIASLYFEHEVSSFCLEGDYIYYTEHDQWCRVFKKNVVTNVTTQINGGTNGTFYYPKVYLNAEDRILYIGESNSSGSALYYFDADTLKQKSVFKKNNYGIMNHAREIFHIGDEIFWGNFRLSDTNANEIHGKYGTVDYGNMVFASEEVVSTSQGLYLTETYECIIDYYYDDFDFEHILVTDSDCIFFRKMTLEKNILVGVNFELQ